MKMNCSGSFLLLLISLLPSIACTPNPSPVETKKVPTAVSQELTPEPQLTATVLEGIATRLRNIADLRVFLPSSTAPVFFFEDFPEAAEVGREVGRNLSAEFRERFAPGPVPSVAAFTNDEHISEFDPRDPSVCQTEEIGNWVEISPVVFNPIREEYGVFVRSAPKACMPFGGSRFWVALSADEKSKIVQFEKLNVTEF